MVATKRLRSARKFFGHCPVATRFSTPITHFPRFDSRAFSSRGNSQKRKEKPNLLLFDRPSFHKNISYSRSPASSLAPCPLILSFALLQSLFAFAFPIYFTAKNAQTKYHSSRQGRHHHKQKAAYQETFCTWPERQQHLPH